MQIALAQFAPHLSDGSVTAFAGVFVGGVLTSLTPCLYPMIPVTAAVVGGGTADSSRARRMSLAFTYVAGLSITYALLGLVAGLTGAMFGQISTSPWLYFVMANVMLVAGAMMADLVRVPIPAALSARASTMGTGGRFAGVLVMGVASGLVAAPCGAPVMAAVLTWVAATKSAGLGLAYLFVFSLGMSSLLLVIAFIQFRTD